MEIKRRGAPSRTQAPELGWQLAYLDVAAKEGRRFLTDAQYSHAVGLCDQLATEGDPRRPVGLDVRRVEDFFELRDKGNVLGKINLRLYFTVIDQMIVVLGCQKKEAEGKTPGYIKIQMRNRMRFLNRVVKKEGDG